MGHICLDPGHGYPDPGAVGPEGTLEAEVNLMMSKIMSKRLMDLGHNVTCTRTGNNGLSKIKSDDLIQRSHLANRLGVDCFVSIHCNSSDKPTANGSETWYHGNSKTGKRLAETLHQPLTAIGKRRDRGLKQATELSVLRLTVMPAVLVELAFISNPQEEALLKDLEWLKVVGNGLAAAIDAYLKK